MSTGQTMMPIFALILLTTVLMSFYGIVANTGDDIARNQEDILATAVASSWSELAQGLAYDNVTDTSDIAFQNPSALTSPSLLGVDPGEAADTVARYNDFDDFNGVTLTKTADSTGYTFATQFRVSYVDTNDVNTIVSYRSFIKRMDMVTWRTIPAPGQGGIIDTLFTSIVRVGDYPVQRRVAHGHRNGSVRWARDVCETCQRSGQSELPAGSRG